MSVRPALTAEEWAGWSSVGVELDEGVDGVLVQRIGVSRIDIEPERGTVATFDDGMIHALAALCLHGQPFGFTRADVELVLRHDLYDHEHPTAKALRDLAGRIAALLPPENE